MKVVYHCFGGAHASPTAAAIHLGILASDRLPSLRDFKRVPYFDQITSLEHGRLIKVGDDHLNNEIFILGRRNSATVTINIIKEFSKLNGVNPDDYLFVDCVQLYNPLMVTGGFSSRAMGLVKVGRPLVTIGTLLSFTSLVKKVKKTLELLEKRTG